MRQDNLSVFQKKFILLEFARELIKHSVQGEISELRNILDERHKIERLKPEKIKKATQDLEKSIMSLRGIPSGNLTEGIGGSIKMRIEKHPRKIQAGKSFQPMIIPKEMLPPRFQYLKPTPTKIEIDLGKLNPLINDPLVRDIECPGANQKIIVDGMMGRKKTGIALTRDEIEEIIEKFSENAKIPVQEGFFKVVVGKLILSAIVSYLITSKFTIRKMVYNPGFK